MTERVTIARLGRRGDGVADTPHGPVFVPFTLPGETVVVGPWPGHPDRRLPIAVERESSERIVPLCPHFGTCGGCALQHWTAADYRAWKRDRVVDALSQTGLDTPVDGLIDAHGEGRRRVVLHARRGGRDVLTVGFAAPRAHRIVAIDRCPILAPGLDGALPAAWEIAETLGRLRKPLDIHATATETGIDIDLRGSGPLTAQATAALARVADRHALARLTRHGEIVALRATPTVIMGRAQVALPPGAFLQATAEGEAVLAALVTDHCGGATRIADLFAGCGPFALRLAERARVSAFDSDKDAIAALKRAAETTQGLKPVTAETRDLFRRPLLPQELNAFDRAVLDPPRQGAEAQARALAVSKVPLVLAVSCNAATFARDVGILTDGGYRLTRVTPVDQFRYSPHVEIVARLAR
jgi:23S rRNA (uracil1939-C5)-methyltransferase